MSTPAPAAAATGGKSVGQILGASFDLYKKNLGPFLVTAAIALGPVYLVKSALVAGFAMPTTAAAEGLQARGERMRALGEEMQQKQQAGTLTPEEAERISREMTAAQTETAAAAVGAMGGIFVMLLGLLLTIPLVLAANFLAQGALTALVADRAQGGTMGPAGAWGVVLQSLGGLMVTTLLTMLLVGVGLVMCVVPGLVLGFFCAFAIPVTLLERQSGVEAIKRSFALVKRDWLRVAVVLIVFAVLGWLAGAVGGLFVPDRFAFLNMLAGDALSLVLLPWPIIGLVLLYQDLRAAAP